MKLRDTIHEYARPVAAALSLTALVGALAYGGKEAPPQTESGPQAAPLVAWPPKMTSRADVAIARNSHQDTEGSRKLLYVIGLGGLGIFGLGLRNVKDMSEIAPNNNARQSGWQEDLSDELERILKSL